MEEILLITYIVVAVSISLFYGFKAVNIFVYPEIKQEQPKYKKSWFIHQFLFNFFGSLAGWFLVFVFIGILNDVPLKDLNFVHLLVFLFGVLGIVGLLPTSLVQVSDYLGKLMKRLAGASSTDRF